MSNSFDYLIAGLGNPGKKYEHNRHNIGWKVISAICEKYKQVLENCNPLSYQAEAVISSKRVLLCQPTTYMNGSGEAVALLLKKYQIAIQNLIVICDEYNFQVGKVHFRLSGSDGGHNGIASIIEHLDTTEFYRLRCGIGKNFEPGAMVDYVLSNFAENEITQVDKMIKHSIDAIEHFLRYNPARAISEINSEKLWKGTPTSKKSIIEKQEHNETPTESLINVNL
ncbi:MAG: aminoacyl-tRNA hydrolase [Candidatus Kapabacteria bacterium]|nr:aminoacyl-tRNA hydrolase [Candidatus Kapabacteria bacterium]